MLDWLRKKFTPVPKTVYFIVAENFPQATYWAERYLDPDKHLYCYVGSPEQIRGRAISPNQVMYVGTFYLRDDLEEIADVVTMASRLPVL